MCMFSAHFLEQFLFLDFLKCPEFSSTLSDLF
jgi:hypothetical protein